MTGDPFRRAQPGQALQIPAAAYNAFLDASAANQRNQQTGVRSGSTELRSSTLIRVRNTSGRDLKQFEVLGIDAPIFDPQDSLDAFRREVTFRGVVPDEQNTPGVLLSCRNQFETTESVLPSPLVSRSLVCTIRPKVRTDTMRMFGRTSSPAFVAGQKPLLRSSGPMMFSGKVTCGGLSFT